MKIKDTTKFTESITTKLLALVGRHDNIKIVYNKWLGVGKYFDWAHTVPFEP